MEAILVDNLQQSGSHVGSAMIALDNLEFQELRLEHPVIWLIRWCVDVVSHDRKVWVRSLLGPCVKCD